MNSLLILTKLKLIKTVFSDNIFIFTDTKRLTLFMKYLSFYTDCRISKYQKDRRANPCELYVVELNLVK